MKICSKCGKAYSDETLNFCLDDGAVLTSTASSGPVGDATIRMDQTDITKPSDAAGTQAHGVSIAPSATTAKSRSTWPWVIGILLALGLICGGGLGGCLVFLSNVELPDENSNNARPRPSVSPTSNNTYKPSSGNSSSPSNSTNIPGDATEVPLAEWVKTDSEFGNTSFTDDGEFVMSSKGKAYYYAVAATDEYTSENATSSVIVRNIDSEPSQLGYGLVFHSNVKPLQKGYAFLIDTQSGKYRVVRHEPGKETVVVPWTASDRILRGGIQNTLSVEDNSDGIALLINGVEVKRIKNTYGEAKGVVGLYAGDGIKIGFRELKIAR